MKLTAGIKNIVSIEYLALIVFIIILMVIYRIGFNSYIFLIIAAIVGVIVYIILNKFFKVRKHRLLIGIPPLTCNRIRLSLSILFFLSYGLSIITLLQGFYTKTVWYYILIALCTGAIAAEIFFVETRAQGYTNLLKSFMLVLNITLSNQIVFSYGIGLPDMASHVDIISSIINSGYVPNTNFGYYQFFPAHHILVAIDSIISAINVKTFYCYLGGVCVSTGILFVFIIGYRFINLRFGLLCSLIYISLDYLIMYGSHPVHMSYIYLFSIAILTYAFLFYLKRDIGYLIIFTISAISLNFMHHFSALIVLIVLLTIAVLQLVRSTLLKKISLELPLVTAIFTIILVLQWTFYSGMFGSILLMTDTITSTLPSGSTISNNGNNTVVSSNNSISSANTLTMIKPLSAISNSIIKPMAYDKLPLITIFFNTLGSDILIILSIIGLFYFIKTASFFKQSITIICMVLGFLLGIGLIINQFWLLPDRMYPFLELFGMVFLVAGALYWVAGQDKNSNGYSLKGKKIFSLSMILVIIVIMCLAFFTSSSTIEGFETSIFIDSSIAYQKLYDTPHEISLKQWVLEYVPDTKKMLNTLPIDEKGNVDLSDINNDSFVVFNKFYLKTGYSIEYGPHLGQYYFITLDENKFKVLDEKARYYSNGMIELYHINDQKNYSI